jgi:hypothetical protein
MSQLSFSREDAKARKKKKSLRLQFLVFSRLRADISKRRFEARSLAGTHSLPERLIASQARN